MNIGIIGSGTVGGATGKVLKALGNDVTFCDVSEQKLLALKKEGHPVTSKIEELVSQTQVSFVCVNTPTDSRGEQDLSAIQSVVSVLARTLDHVTHHHLIVFRSTLLPGTMTNFVTRSLESRCGRKRGKDYDVCYNPEFLTENNAIRDMFSPDRIVIGEDREGASSCLQELYRPLRSRILVTTFEGAELIKYASNCFLALKISFFNEIGLACRKIGVDDRIVSKGVSLDRRIGTYGVMFGRPFDGKCFPKDLRAWVSFAGKLGLKPDLIQGALEINKIMKAIAELPTPLEPDAGS